MCTHTLVYTYTHTHTYRQEKLIKFFKNKISMERNEKNINTKIMQVRFEQLMPRVRGP